LKDTKIGVSNDLLKNQRLSRSNSLGFS